MSRSRVKNIGFDEDDYADDDYDEADEEISPEDRERMRVCSAEVSDLLRSDIPPVPATDEEIWEALWHYYYDVERSVAYLRKKYRPAEQPKKAKKEQLQGKRMASYPASSLSCKAQFSAREFFKDSPWLNVPADRKADILIEPLYPRLGLLGGAPEGGVGTGKPSKLAALAAARKKKEGQSQAQAQAQADGGVMGKALSATDATGTTAASSAQETNRSLALLDRLVTNGRDRATSEERTAQLPLRKADRNRQRTAQQTSPSAAETVQPRSKPETPRSETVPTASAKVETENQEDRRRAATADLRARPSKFARTIVGHRNGKATPRSDCFSAAIDMTAILDQSFTKGFDFTEPSPDDVVIKAQSAAKGNKTKTAATKKTPSKPAAEVTEGVKQLSVQEPVKVKSKNLDVVAEYNKSERKKSANFVVIGHVDAGKSTLMGRLLLDLKSVDQRTLDKYRKEADKIGKGSFALAWVLDQGSEERARGVTIDFATNKFETEETSFTILDAPGHRDFVPNMIAGASQADFAVLVIDASTGNFESGLKGQTKEHALLVRSMGAQKIVVAVNKMDSVDWSKDRFDEIQQQTSSFLTTAGFQRKNISFVPCSGLQGDNVMRRSEDKNVAWYTGGTLVQELETSERYSYAVDKPLRMTIGDVFRGGVQNPLSISGRIDAGHLQGGEEILVMPSGERATIKSLEVDEEGSDWAVAGQIATLHLAGIDPVHLKTGDVICSPTSPIQNVTTFTAKVLAFDHLTPMHIDVHRGRLHVPGRISSLVATLDKGSGAPIKKKPKIVAPGAVARVVVEMEQSIPLEAPTRIVLRAGGETVAAGLLE